MGESNKIPIMGSICYHKVILIYLFIFSLEHKWIEALNLDNGIDHKFGLNVDNLRMKRDADAETGQSSTAPKTSTTAATETTTPGSTPRSTTTKQSTSSTTPGPQREKSSSDEQNKQSIQITKTLEEYDTCVENHAKNVVDLTYFTTQTGKLSCNYCFRPETDIDAIKLKWIRQRKYSRYASHVPVDASRFSVDVNHDLLIKGILAEDAGKYICRGELEKENKEEDLDDQSTYEITVLHHGSGREESYDKCLQMKEKIWLSGEKPVEPLTFTVGQTARITCHVCIDEVQSPESGIITWQRGVEDADSFEDIPPDDPHYKEDGLDLVITEVQEEDAGRYRCTGEQSRVESSYLVDVTGESMEPTEAVLFITGHHAVLKCQVGEQTDIELEWRYQSFHGGSRHILPLDGEKYIFSKDFNLIITSLTLEDAGNYECRNIHHSLYYLNPDDPDRDPGWEVVARYHVDVVAHEKIQLQVTLEGESNALEDKQVEGHDYLMVYTVWADWTPCDTCNDEGRRRKIGTCKVKLSDPGGAENIPEDLSALSQYIDGLPCRSPSLPSKYANLPDIKERPSELIIDKCTAECPNKPEPQPGVNGSLITDAGIDGAPEDLDTETIIMSMPHEPVYSPEVVDKIINKKDEDSLLLECPRVGESTSSIEWWHQGNRVGKSYWNADGKTRVGVDDEHRLFFTHLDRFKDNTQYKCWSEGHHIATFSLNVGERGMPPYIIFFMALATLIAFGVLGYVMYAIYPVYKSLMWDPYSSEKEDPQRMNRSEEGHCTDADDTKPVHYTDETKQLHYTDDTKPVHYTDDTNPLHYTDHDNPLHYTD